MMHTDDPAAARYRLDPARLDLAREFRAKIRGPHSEELRALLNRMRWGPLQGRWVLVVADPGRAWWLAEMPGKRGLPVKIDKSRLFTSLDEAEWHVFTLRWRALTGQELKLD